MPAVANRAGVHATTVYRRWQTIESLLLDVVVSDVRQASPVPATGDLRADLTGYIDGLLTSLRGPHALRLLRALLAASQAAPDLGTVSELVKPRVDDFQAMLDAADVTTIDGMGCIELVIAPAYLWAQLGAPLDPAKDTERLVSTVLRTI